MAERDEVQIVVKLIDDTRTGAASVKSSLESIGASASRMGAMGLAGYAAPQGFAGAIGQGGSQYGRQGPASVQAGPELAALPAARRPIQFGNEGAGRVMPALPPGVIEPRWETVTNARGTQMQASAIVGGPGSTTSAAAGGTPIVGAARGASNAPPRPPPGTFSGWNAPFQRAPTTGAQAAFGAVAGVAGNLALIYSTIAMWQSALGNVRTQTARVQEDLDKGLQETEEMRQATRKQYGLDQEALIKQRDDITTQYDRDQAVRDRTRRDELKGYQKQFEEFGTRREQIEKDHAKRASQLIQQEVDVRQRYEKQVADFEDQRAEVKRQRADQEFQFKRAEQDQEIQFSRQIHDLDVTRREEIKAQFDNAQQSFDRANEDFDRSISRRKQALEVQSRRETEDYDRNKQELESDITFRKQIRDLEREQREDDKERRQQAAKEQEEQSGIQQFLALGGLINAAQSGDPFAIIGALYRLQQAGREKEQAQAQEEASKRSDAIFELQQKHQDELDQRARDSLERGHTRAGEDLGTERGQIDEDVATHEARILEDQARLTREHEAAVKALDEAIQRVKDDNDLFTARMIENRQRADDAQERAIAEIQKKQEEAHNQELADLALIATQRAENDQEQRDAEDALNKEILAASDEHRERVQIMDGEQKIADDNHKEAIAEIGKRMDASTDQFMTNMDALDKRDAELQIQRVRRLEDLERMRSDANTQAVFGMGLQLIFAGQLISALRSAATILGITGAAASALPASAVVGGSIAGVAVAGAVGLGAAIGAGGYEAYWEYTYHEQSPWRKALNALMSGQVSFSQLDKAIQDYASSITGLPVGVLSQMDPAMLIGIVGGAQVGQSISAAVSGSTPGQAAPGASPTSVAPGTGPTAGQGGPGTMPDPTDTARQIWSDSLTVQQWGGQIERDFPGYFTAVCAEIAAAGLAKAFGKPIDPSTVVQMAIDSSKTRANRYQFSNENGTGGPGLENLVEDLVPGGNLRVSTQAEAEAYLRQGIPVVVNPNPAGTFRGHYMLGQSIDAAGNVDFGQSGWAMGIRKPVPISSVNRGGGIDFYVLDVAGQPGAGAPMPAPANTGGSYGPGSSSTVVPTEWGGGQGGTLAAAVPLADTPDAIEAFIRARAPLYGIDPDDAVGVWKGEGSNPWTGQSNATYHGAREPSYGPFQLLMEGGVGEELLKTYGIDARDPAQAQAATDFALWYASQNGWSFWHGAARGGVTGEWQGITKGVSPSSWTPGDWKNTTVTGAMYGTASTAGAPQPSPPGSTLEIAGAPTAPSGPMPVFVVNWPAMDAGSQFGIHPPAQMPMRALSNEEWFAKYGGTLYRGNDGGFVTADGTSVPTPPGFEGYNPEMVEDPLAAQAMQWEGSPWRAVSKFSGADWIALHPEDPSTWERISGGVRTRTPGEVGEHFGEVDIAHEVAMMNNAIQVIKQMVVDGQVVAKATINGVVFSKQGEESILQTVEKWATDGRTS